MEESEIIPFATPNSHSPGQTDGVVVMEVVPDGPERQGRVQNRRG